MREGIVYDVYAVVVRANLTPKHAETAKFRRLHSQFQKTLLDKPHFWTRALLPLAIQPMQMYPRLKWGLPTGRIAKSLTQLSG